MIKKIKKNSKKYKIEEEEDIKIKKGRKDEGVVINHVQYPEHLNDRNKKERNCARLSCAREYLKIPLCFCPRL